MWGGLSQEGLGGGGVTAWELKWLPKNLGKGYISKRP